MDEIKKIENKIISEFELLMSSKDSTHLGLVLGEEQAYEVLSKRLETIKDLLYARKITKMVYTGLKGEEDE